MSITSPELARKLSTASIGKTWDVYSAFDWPESLPDDPWYVSPQPMPLYGTPYFDSLTEAQQKKLSFTEICNFCSLGLPGRPLAQWLVHRLYLKQTKDDITEYFRHFIDEEKK